MGYSVCVVLAIILGEQAWYRGCHRPAYLFTEWWSLAIAIRCCIYLSFPKRLVGLARMGS